MGPLVAGSGRSSRFRSFPFVCCRHCDDSGLGVIPERYRSRSLTTSRIYSCFFVFARNLLPLLLLYITPPLIPLAYLLPPTRLSLPPLLPHAALCQRGAARYCTSYRIVYYSHSCTLHIPHARPPMETPRYHVTDNLLPLVFQLELDESSGGQIYPWPLMTSVSSLVSTFSV